MWELQNRTPFSAERAVLADRHGRDLWVVAVKGTFRVGFDGTTTPVDDQPPVLLAPVHIGDPASSSLLYENDLDYTKMTTDVVLNGHAYAPAGRAVRRVDVRMRVHSIDKSVRVYGDRTWKRGPFGLRLGRPAPFTKSPITYERAYGGATRDLSAWEPRNPVGTGFVQRRGQLHNLPAPPWSTLELECPSGEGARRRSALGLSRVAGNRV